MTKAIKIENLSKAYQLGEFSTGTLSRDIERWWALLRGKEDPFLKVGEVNDRTQHGNGNIVWSLKDINFEVEQGATVGIIGRNGAGKSTLLKVLSRVTSPSKGVVKVKGRIASLLEVGTGFHPELTGRENIFLNGAILGMRKHEIKRKFDEIVDFAGVERYIDTPVKRYSSGMYVRLAFGVAAHLDSEILVVDEVLAVGDAEFQKKCLGKMGDVSKMEGRTILFVSHNLTAVETLCKRGVYLQNGGIKYSGDAREAITQYLKNELRSANSFKYHSLDDAIGNEKMKILSGSVVNPNDPSKFIDVSSPVNIAFTVVNLSNDPSISIGYDLLDMKGDVIFGSGKFTNCPIGKEVIATCKIPSNFLNDGSYTVTIYAHDKNMSTIIFLKDLMTFEVKDVERENAYLGKVNGAVRPSLPWEFKII
jgi:lipopolysaccharide transport system ATP-binding protein